MTEFVFVRIFINTGNLKFLYVQHKILIGENFDDFDKLQVICHICSYIIIKLYSKNLMT